MISKMIKMQVTFNIIQYTKLFPLHCKGNIGFTLINNKLLNNL